MNFEMSKEVTLKRLAKLMDLAGKKRFQTIVSIHQTRTPKSGWTPVELEYEYFKINTEVYEAMVFTDRLHNRGFFRYSQNAIELYMEDLMNALNNAKNHNLI